MEELKIVTWRVYLQHPDGSSPGYHKIMRLQTRAAQKHQDLEYQGHDPDGKGVYWTTQSLSMVNDAIRAGAYVVREEES